MRRFLMMGLLLAATMLPALAMDCGCPYCGTGSGRTAEPGMVMTGSNDMARCPFCNPSDSMAMSMTGDHDMSAMHSMPMEKPPVPRPEREMWHPGR